MIIQSTNLGWGLGVKKFKYWSGDRITKLEDNQIFVFGSNPEGRHGMGAAKDAMKFGAVYGKGRGLHGQTYALVTKNLTAGYEEKMSHISLIYNKQGKRSVSLEWIKMNILGLYSCARDNPALKFFIVYKSSASNLNGYSSDEIFKTFVDNMDVPDNIYFHNSFRGVI